MGATGRVVIEALGDAHAGLRDEKPTGNPSPGSGLEASCECGRSGHTVWAIPTSLQGSSDARGVSTLHGAHGKPSETWSSQWASKHAAPSLLCADRMAHLHGQSGVTNPNSLLSDSSLSSLPSLTAL